MLLRGNRVRTSTCGGVRESCKHEKGTSLWIVHERLCLVSLREDISWERCHEYPCWIGKRVVWQSILETRVRWGIIIRIMKQYSRPIFFPFPSPRLPSARFFFCSCKARIRSSTVPEMTNRSTVTGRVCPKRWTRSKAWLSIASLHPRSREMTRLARVKLRPTPPHFKLCDWWAILHMYLRLKAYLISIMVAFSLAMKLRTEASRWFLVMFPWYLTWANPFSMRYVDTKSRPWVHWEMINTFSSGCSWAQPSRQSIMY